MSQHFRIVSGRTVFVALAIVALATPSDLLAQDFAIDRGSVVIGGTVSYTSQGGELFENTDGDRLNSLLLNPFALFFVTRGLGIGGDFFVQKASQGDQSVTTLGIGPSVAYFFGGPENTAFPFVSGGLEYANLSSTGFDASGFGFNFGAGVAFMVSRGVAVTTQASYEVLNLSVDQLDESFSGNGFGLRAGISAFLF